MNKSDFKQLKRIMKKMDKQYAQSNHRPSLIDMRVNSLGNVTDRAINKWDADMNTLVDNTHVFPIRAYRNPHIGIWLGYVGVPWWNLVLVASVLLQKNNLNITYADWGDGYRLPKGYYWLGIDYGHLENELPFDTDYNHIGGKSTASHLLLDLENLIELLHDLPRKTLKREPLYER